MRLGLRASKHIIECCELYVFFELDVWIELDIGLNLIFWNEDVWINLILFVLGLCDFDMVFIFVWAGWGHDT